MRSSLSSIEAVFFDVGGTLVEVSPSVGHVYAEACGRLGASVAPRDVQRAFDHAWVTLSSEVPTGEDRYRLFDGGETAWWARISEIAFDLCGVAPEHRPDVEDLRAWFARAEAWRVYPEVPGVLEDLRARGVRLGVISNWDSRLPALLRTLGLEGLFEVLIYSAAAGFEKPHPAIFEAGLQAFGIPAGRAAHIGDRYEEDYSGALGAGLRAVLLQRDGSSWRASADGPEVHPAHLAADLRAAIDRLAP
jgi:putative hydrolase of the HAD superfamily